MGKATLQVNRIVEQAKEVKTIHSVFKISLAEEIEIPPRSEIILSTKMPHKPDFKTEIIEGRKTAINRRAITIAKAVINTDQSTIPLRAVNMSNQVQYIRQNTILGTCEEATILPEADLSKTINSPQSDTIPEHLQELFDDVNTRISQEQAKIIKTLFNQYPDIFATSDTDLGRTTLVQHEIKLKDPNATPFKQQSYRIPQKMKAKVKEEIQKLLKSNIIEQSDSHYRSPIVIVVKGDKIRICQDARKLNKNSLKDSYPLPRSR